MVGLDGEREWAVRRQRSARRNFSNRGTKISVVIS